MIPALVFVIAMLGLTGCNRGGGDIVIPSRFEDLEAKEEKTENGEPTDGGVSSDPFVLSYAEARAYAEIVLDVSFENAKETYTEAMEQKEWQDENGFSWYPGAVRAERYNESEEDIGYVQYYDEEDHLLYDSWTKEAYGYFEDGKMAYSISNQIVQYYGYASTQNGIELKASLSENKVLSFLYTLKDEQGHKTEEIYRDNLDYERFREVFGKSGDDKLYFSEDMMFYRISYEWTKADDGTTEESFTTDDGSSFLWKFDENGTMTYSEHNYTIGNDSYQDVAMYDTYGSPVMESYYENGVLQASTQYTNSYVDAEHLLSGTEVYEDEILTQVLNYSYQYDSQYRIIVIEKTNREGAMIEKTEIFYR